MIERDFPIPALLEPILRVALPFTEGLFGHRALLLALVQALVDLAVLGVRVFAAHLRGIGAVGAEHLAGFVVAIRDICAELCIVVALRREQLAAELASPQARVQHDHTGKYSIDISHLFFVFIIIFYDGISINIDT